MNTTDNIFVTVLFTLTLLFLVYMMYQLRRTAAVFNIRRNWSKNDDKRWYQYDFQDMTNTNRSNWYGFRYPKDAHYPSTKQ